MFERTLSIRNLVRTPACLAHILVFAGFSSVSLASPQTGYSGSAYGTILTVSPGTSTLNSGVTAASVLCTEQTGKSNSNHVAAVTLPPLASTGAVDTSVSSAVLDGSTASTATATVAAISLLGGLITGDGVTAVSSSISSGSAFSTSSNGTIFTNVKVLGIPIAVDVAPNTRIALPGIGQVVLNEQTSKVTSAAATLSINMIHVSVNQNNILGLPIGLQFIVAHAESSTLFNEGLLSGIGYGSFVAAGPVTSGPSAAITLPCSGTTNGAVKQNDVAGVVVPGILALGAVHTTAQGSLSPSGASGEITASIAGTNVLSGLVTATTITADAHASIDSGNITLSDSGSLFAGLAVLGHPEIGANPAPNTKVTIAGLGTLWLHRVIQTSTSIEVRMVELVVNTANSLGLPIGADVRLAVAKVGVVNQ